MVANSLAAFALVADEFTKSGDPVRGLAPLFRPILQDRAGTAYDPAWFAGRFTDAYGLAMTPYVAKSIAQKLVSVGLLTKSSPDGYVVAPIPAAHTDVPSITEGTIQDIVGYFEKYAAKEIDRLGINAQKIDFEKTLLDRLAHPEFASVFLEKGKPRDSDKIRRLLGKGELNQQSNLDQFFDFLVARFILIADESAPDVFDTLASVAFGGLIADAVAGLAVSGISRMPEPPLRVVIDGPLLLDILDLSTPQHFEYAKRLFEMMARAKFRLAVFDHILDEVRESIRSTVHAHSAGLAYGPLGDRLRSTPGLSIRAIHIADTLDENLGDLGIVVLRSDIYENRPDFKNYFDDKRVDAVRNAIGDIHHQHERRIRDTKSVATVARLKKDNRRPSSVFEAGTIFLTRNSALAKQVNRVLASGKSEPDPRFTIVTDGQFACVMWFSMGSVNDFSAFSKKRLIANCSSAIVTQREVIQRVADMLETVDDKLKCDFEIMMHDKRASMCMMRETDGYVDAISNEKSVKILEAMRQEIAAPLLEPTREELSKKRQELGALELRMRGSRQANAELQDAIIEQASSFDVSQAQMSVALEGERATKTRLRTELNADIESAKADVVALSDRLERRRAVAAHVLIWIWVAACFIAVFLSVFSEVMRNNWIRGIVFLVLLTTLGVGRKWAAGWVCRLVDRASTSLVARIKSGAAQQSRFEELLSELGKRDGGNEASSASSASRRGWPRVRGCAGRPSAFSTMARNLGSPNAHSRCRCLPKYQNRSQSRLSRRSEVSACGFFGRPIFFGPTLRPSCASIAWRGSGEN